MELLWCSTARGQHKLPVSDLIIGSASVTPVSSVRDLGIFIDADLIMRTHVQRTVSRCFAALRQLRSIRSHVPTAIFRSLVVSLVLTRLDYGNSVLVGLSANLLRRLQSVQNAAARLIYKLRRSDHITDVLVNLHWLRVAKRVEFKVAVLTFRALHGCAPSYLTSLFTRVADMPSRRALRSASSSGLLVPFTRLRTVGSRAFSVAGTTIWNNLPANITVVESLPEFRRLLKTFLFTRSFPNIRVFPL
jgi:hypothetical protein